jgi:outer membrane protein assembly factor BamE (lipoprotein component of BamABCDE complex)
MTKKHMLLVPAFALIFLFCSVAGTAAFQCDNHYISVGSFRDEVLELCGEPSMSDSWQEERLVDLYIRDNGQWAAARRVLVTVDRWTYNFGPTHHMQTLTFENAKLISIQSGRTGY